MSALRRKARRMTLMPTPDGLDSFRVDGSVDGRRVWATWNVLMEVGSASALITIGRVL
jgi:hypothetical protein